MQNTLFKNCKEFDSFGWGLIYKDRGSMEGQLPPKKRED